MCTFYFFHRYVPHGQWNSTEKPQWFELSAEKDTILLQTGLHKASTHGISTYVSVFFLAIWVFNICAICVYSKDLTKNNKSLFLSYKLQTDTFWLTQKLAILHIRGEWVGGWVDERQGRRGEGATWVARWWQAKPVLNCRDLRNKG